MARLHGRTAVGDGQGMCTHANSMHTGALRGANPPPDLGGAPRKGRLDTTAWAWLNLVHLVRTRSQHVGRGPMEARGQKIERGATGSCC
eukprot:281148-Chlamydomonas_euryale.AAC.2